MNENDNENPKLNLAGPLLSLLLASPCSAVPPLLSCGSCRPHIPHGTCTVPVLPVRTVLVQYRYWYGTVRQRNVGRNANHHHHHEPLRPTNCGRMRGVDFSSDTKLQVDVGWCKPINSPRRHLRLRQTAGSLTENDACMHAMGDG